MANIQIDRLAAELANAVQAYADDVSAAIEAEVADTADKVLAEVKATAPKNTGEYAKTFTKTKRRLKTHGSVQFVVWNRKHYRRVHLLEFGHARAGGGPRVEARPHLRPAYDKHAGEMVERIKRIIRNGG